MKLSIESRFTILDELRLSRKTIKQHFEGSYSSRSSFFFWAPCENSAPTAMQQVIGLSRVDTSPASITAHCYVECIFFFLFILFLYLKPTYSPIEVHGDPEWVSKCESDFIVAPCWEREKVSPGRFRSPSNSKSLVKVRRLLSSPSPAESSRRVTSATCGASDVVSIFLVWYGEMDRGVLRNHSAWPAQSTVPLPRTF